MPTFNFKTIGFNPTTGELSIKDANGSHLVIQEEPLIKSPFNLSTTGVKLEVINSTTVDIVLSQGVPFVTKNFELKLKWKGNTYNSNMNFGAMKHTSVGDESIFYEKKIPNEDKFHLSWIGSDDIRVNNTRPGGILLMEGEEMSFEIVDESGKKYLIIRYDS
jgi:hypothetical protein